MNFGLAHSGDRQPHVNYQTESSQVDKNQKLFLDQTLVLVRESQSTDSQVQQHVQKKLDEWGILPEFNYSLMQLLSDQQTCEEQIRSLCCFILKNNVRNHFHHFSEELKAMLAKQSIELLRDKSSVIRAHVGLLVTAILSYDRSRWSEYMPNIERLLNDQDEDIVEVAASTIRNIFEDSINSAESYEQLIPLLMLVPRMLDLHKHASAKIRNHALNCIIQILEKQMPALYEYIDRYVEALFTLANDNDTEVKKNVCRSWVLLFEVMPKDIYSRKLLPHLPVVILYMMSKSIDTDEQVALEACEFWLTISKIEDAKHIVRQYLPQLVPFLMQKMRYSSEDIEMMLPDLSADYMVPDKEDDIKPRFYRSKAPGDLEQTNSKTGDFNGDDQDISDLSTGQLEDEEDEDDDDDDFADDGGMCSSWNIRKCTAAALDSFAQNYGEEILPFVIQELQKHLQDQDWVVKEAAILAIGAVADGSLQGMTPHLPALLPYLLDNLGSTHPMLRSITCWTISRYTHWIVSKCESAQFDQILTNLLCRVLDDNKRVQEAACSAFATLVEGAGDTKVVPHLDQIIHTLVQAFDKYQHKNLLNLYDAVGTLAEIAKHNLNQPKYIDMILPPIIKRWNALGDQDPDLFPLLECLSSIAVALCEGFLPHSEAVYRRCLSLVEQNLQQAMAHELDPQNVEMPYKDFMIAALDLLSGLAEGLKSDISNLVETSHVMVLIARCLMDSSPEVRQSSLALLGDLTKACFRHVQPHINDVMANFAKNLDYEHKSVCNNAAWALGELAMRMGDSIKPYLPMLLPQLLANIRQPDIPRTLLDNTAICLGRLSCACPDDLAPVLNEFIKPWCSSVRSIRSIEAKDSAFRGVCMLIQKNPNGIVNNFFDFCDAIACYDDPQPDLKQTFYDILHCFKNQVGEQQWQTFRSTFPVEMREKLQSHYSV